jgi:drug/metabolite transporter (DMT)-like permease
MGGRSTSAAGVGIGLWARSRSTRCSIGATATPFGNGLILLGAFFWAAELAGARAQMDIQPFVGVREVLLATVVLAVLQLLEGPLTIDWTCSWSRCCSSGRVSGSRSPIGR